MGDSMPPPATFDLVESFARRRGGDVEIVLAEPKADIATSAATVQLRRGSATVRAAAELVVDADGRRLTIRAPRERFTDGIWTLQLLEDGEVVQGLAARLLVQGQRPLVLLWGATARATRLPPVRRPRTGRQRVVSVGATALDRTLSVLPDDRAAQVRGRVRKAARRLLG